MKSFTHDAPELMLQALAAAVAGVGPGKSLSRKVDAARTYYAAPDVPATCAVLVDFRSEVKSQRGKKLSIALAGELMTDAAAIMGVIGCQ
jgi:hypothetical protein